MDERQFQLQLLCETIAKGGRLILDEVRRASLWPLSLRLQWLRYIEELLARRRDEILATVAQEKGCHEHQVLMNEYVVMRWLCQYYHRHAAAILKDENRSRFWSLCWGNKKVIVKKEPWGIVGIISPSNYPFSLPLGAVISALLAGNVVFLKPSEETPRTNQLLAELLTASLRRFTMEPFCWISPSSRLMGQVLVQSPHVDKVHFTGSIQAGLNVLQENVRVRLTPPTLELGGSNAAIVLEDADIKQTVRVIVWARFCGMSCNNIKRVFAAAPIYEQLWQELERQMGELQRHEVGPIPEKEIARYAAFLNDYFTYLKQPAAYTPQEGLRPRLLRVEEPTDALLALREETFIPLLPVVRVRDEDEAVLRANDSRFGLGASVFTKDKNHFRRVASRLECGGVYHNDAMTEFAQPQVPFGGWKESGYGYSHGPEGLLEFVRLKTVIEERWLAPKLQLFPWTMKKMKWLKKLSQFLIRFS